MKPGKACLDICACGLFQTVPNFQCTIVATNDASLPQLLRCAYGAESKNNPTGEATARDQKQGSMPYARKCRPTTALPGRYLYMAYRHPLFAEDLQSLVDYLRQTNSRSRPPNYSCGENTVLGYVFIIGNLAIFHGSSPPKSPSLKPKIIFSIGSRHLTNSATRRRLFVCPHC